MSITNFDLNRQKFVILCATKYIQTPDEQEALLRKILQFIPSMLRTIMKSMGMNDWEIAIHYFDRYFTQGADAYDSAQTADTASPSEEDSAVEDTSHIQDDQYTFSLMSDGTAEIVGYDGQGKVLFYRKPGTVMQ